MGIVPVQENNSNFGAPTRCTDNNSRYGEQTNERLQQLDAEQESIQSNQPPMGPHTDGPLCRPTERSGREVHELASRPRGSGHGRISDNMEQLGMLCFILPDNEVPGESSEGERRNSHSNPGLANPAILPYATEHVCLQPHLVAANAESASMPRGEHPTTHENTNSEISGVESFRRQKEAAGVSKQTSELLAAGWRQGTQTAYNSCWRQWRSWCNTRQVDPFHTSVEHIADFLSELWISLQVWREQQTRYPFMHNRIYLKKTQEYWEGRRPNCLWAISNHTKQWNLAL